MAFPKTVEIASQSMIAILFSQFFTPSQTIHHLVKKGDIQASFFIFLYARL